MEVTLGAGGERIPGYGFGILMLQVATLIAEPQTANPERKP